MKSDENPALNWTSPRAGHWKSLSRYMGHFRVHFCIYFRVGPRARSFFYEFKSSFTLKLELITTTKISHLHSLWKSDRLRELGNGLLHARQENFHASHMIPIIPWRLSRAWKFLVRHRRSESRGEKILEIARELIVGKTEPRWAFSPDSVESKKTYFIKWFKQKNAILKSHFVR